MASHASVQRLGAPRTAPITPCRRLACSRRAGSARLVAAALRPTAQQHHHHHHDGGSAAAAASAGGAASAAAAAMQQPQQQQQHPAQRAPPTAAVALAAPPAAMLEPLGPNGSTAAGPPRLRVAVDVDEVLGRFVHALNGYVLEARGEAYDVSDYWVYEYAKVWGVTPQESARVVHAFFESPHFTNGIPVIPGAAAALRRLGGAGADLVVVTSRQHVIQDATLRWLDAHFEGVFSEVYFGNHFALEGPSRSKSEICAAIGAHVLIDDNVGYALDCAANGVRVLLFDWRGAYPWSKLPEEARHPNITVVRDWAEAEAALAAVAEAVGAAPPVAAAAADADSSGSSGGSTAAAAARAA